MVTDFTSSIPVPDRIKVFFPTCDDAANVERIFDVLSDYWGHLPTEDLHAVAGVLYERWGFPAAGDLHFLNAFDFAAAYFEAKLPQ
jgi:hypothetical protein